MQNRNALVMGSIICAVAGLFYCYEFILRIIPGALQSELSEALGNISATTFGEIAVLYYIAYSPMQLPVGMLMDRFGPRRLLTFACFSCTIGSWLFSCTESIFLVSLGRFLVGFGSSFAFVGVLSLATNWLPKRYFSLVVGLITTFGMLGNVYAAVKVAHITASVGLNTVLMSLAGIGGLITGIIFLSVYDGPEGHKPHSQPLKEFFSSVLEVLLSPQVWVIGIVGACLYTSLSVFGELWGMTYLEQAHQLTKVQAAETISFLFLGWAVGAPLLGYISDKTGKRVLPIAIGALLSLLCISAVLYWPGLPLNALKTLLFLYGVFSGAEIIVFVMAKENSGALLSGTVFAATNMIVMLGGVVFQPLVGKLLDSVGDSQLINGKHIYTVLDYQVALALIPLSLVLVLVLSFFLKDRNGKPLTP